jgi:hypothetical protein
MHAYAPTGMFTRNHEVWLLAAKIGGLALSFILGALQIARYRHRDGVVYGSLTIAS